MSRLSIYLFSLFFLFAGQLFSQNFSGKIVDTENRPIYGSTVYIKEANQGLICNDKGEFQTNLSNGNYSIAYNCLGYKPVSEKISIQNNTIVRNIVLSEYAFELKEVTITNKEDPAYPIIRKAIEKAPFYLNAAKRYTAEAYIKANMELTNITGIVNKMASMDGLKMGDFKNQLFVQESYNEIKFAAPDKYTQEVKAFSSSLPDNYDPKEAFGIMTASIYSPFYNKNVSPLNPKAFSYYRYRYEGFNEENGIVINKIKFESKYKNRLLLNGYLYIADNTWHVHYAELSRDVFGFKQNFLITYQGVDSELYLPITYSSVNTIDILGTKGYFNYYSSLKYSDIEVNEDVALQINKVKLKQRNLEIKLDSLYTIKTDTLATKRDSIFWSEIRTLPLNDIEKTSYLRKDSIQHRVDSLKKQYHNPKFSISSLIFGGRIASDTAKVSFRYDGLLQALPEYNFVDGAWLGQKVYIKTRFDKHNFIEVSPYAYYTWGRGKLVYGGDIQLNYAPLKNGVLKLSGGSISEDFNPNGITRFDNFIASAMYRESDSYFYLKDFVSGKNTIDITNGLRLNTSFEIAKRRGTTNHANWGIWGNPNKIKPNIYSSDRFDVSSYTISLKYAPRAYYTVWKGKKYYKKIASPQFTVEYKEGFSSWQTNNSKYRVIRGEMSQKIQLDFFSRLDYLLGGGSFLGNADQTHFTDYQHFNTSRMFSISKWPYNTYVLLQNYEASTNRHWLQGFVNYESQYLLLKRIPFLQKLPLTENIHLKTLYTPDFKIYSEIGYSIDFMRLGNIGAHVSFREGKYEAFGFRLCYILKDILKIL